VTLFLAPTTFLALLALCLGFDDGVPKYPTLVDLVVGPLRDLEVKATTVAVRARLGDLPDKSAFNRSTRLPISVSQ
jgi:hypothetical protein